MVNGDNIRFNYEFKPVTFSSGDYKQFIILTRNIKAYRFRFTFCTFILHGIYYFILTALIPITLGLIWLPQIVQL